MTHYYFDLFNSLITIDKHGHDLPDLETVRHEVRRTLPAMLEDCMQDRDSAQIRIDVRDGNNKRVLTATVLMVMESLPQDERSLTASPGNGSTRGETDTE